ncbi:hypothetical protein TPE_0340 [Treponema pedis str. T A4]|uniref:Uncharacterized protein n=1 Tax=Treponema pedis str. T A4 TaxID=1291379 RepID=S6A2N6_9SPIR|nr:hypothetical protein TPE_0340 [Treponema pedis str. T A4]
MYPPPPPPVLSRGRHIIFRFFYLFLQPKLFLPVISKK